ncbi:tetratricopeptide repeat protein [Hydrogenophaga sp. RWCD_12]|uniref:tetratricopeptide repeat protein n=1 Tax=Hydrogenophaga sp. RWCD_12 TaxID=3391190 RepID=UPI00398553DC
MSLKASLAGWCMRWQVRLWLVAGQKSRASDCLTQRLAVQPDDRYALASLAVLQAGQGNRAGAVQTLEHLVRVAPGLATAWFNLGFLLETMDRLEDAEAAFRRATDMDPGLDRAWYGLGICLIRLRRFDGAVEALRRNTALQPMSPFGWYQLARVHADRQEPEEALRIIRHLRGFEPRVAAQLVRETGLGLPGASADGAVACP